MSQIIPACLYHWFWFGFCVSSNTILNAINDQTMIKILKLQKAVIAILMGVFALIAYLILNANDVEWSVYVLEACGLCFMSAALLFFYPILFARKDKDGCVELDPEVAIEQPADEIERN